jgi:hypothetical protein
VLQLFTDILPQTNNGRTRNSKKDILKQKKNSKGI